eukprot:gnl/TRDRNA2_/TRDRNA2_165706_c3_seq2.p1 gnl/TRDRNA2_/TRDRNA2_165706_c3~~gnl/TRDRNA2_/TRDRNA2_165706_c3_seq2.p1  ORF type:complete len:693 (-),score=136.45 gnl/TRDRNA2_/TRDRNA2_165706_c3_seq2:199-2277(-)
MVRFSPHLGGRRLWNGSSPQAEAREPASDANRPQLEKATTGDFQLEAAQHEIRRELNMFRKELLKQFQDAFVEMQERHKELIEWHASCMQSLVDPANEDSHRRSIPPAPVSRPAAAFNDFTPNDYGEASAFSPTEESAKAATSPEGDDEIENPFKTPKGREPNPHKLHCKDDEEGNTQKAVRSALEKKNLSKQVYDVTNFYHTTGLAQKIARSDIFNDLTLAVICANAVYIGVDADHNTAENPLEAHLGFQICDQAFCVYFLFEWTARFFAFRRKRNCLRDMWFKFDSCLVALMVGETWVTPAILLLQGGGGAGLPTGPLRLLRLLRLSRMARLLRSMPELLVMCKGMLVAFRAVSSSMLMVLLLIYVFAIVLHMLLKDEPSVSREFETLPRVMWTLMLQGTFMDNVGEVLMTMQDIGKLNSWLGVGVFVIFILLSAVTVMNMLIGVLCEVVSAVSNNEREEAAIRQVKQTILHLLKEFDDEGDELISRDELQQVLKDVNAIEVLVDLNVDLIYLKMQEELLYEERKEVPIEEIMDLILSCRGDLPGTVKHLCCVLECSRWAMAFQMEKLEEQFKFYMRELARLLIQTRSHSPGHAATSTQQQGAKTTISKSDMDYLQRQIVDKLSGVLGEFVTKPSSSALQAFSAERTPLADVHASQGASTMCNGCGRSGTSGCFGGRSMLRGYALQDAAE